MLMVKLILIQIGLLETNMLIVIPKVTTKKITQNDITKETRKLNWYTGKYPFNKKGIN